MPATDLYPKTEFPEYVFHPYPKWVTPLGREPKIVNSAEEEADYLETALRPEDVVKVELPKPPLSERDQLYADLEAKGLPYDKRWNNERLKLVLAGEDPA